ncbi:phage tail protein [Cellvibrio sp. QJXJ]|uniref:phage tail protein n=1 Tax=Cellvibrio sp. QJXJ TaxID=2964606 RepID=UPI0021C3C2C4|nr:phage tail protein [Cellvibrio sp. QJXJ]UUA73106.1 phage tail protein [Cellvibrio sp. QJXJ]
MAAIINSGRNKIALQQSNSQPLNITKFVFANVPGLDPSAAVDLNQSMPAAEHIVYEKNKDAQGYVAPDQVVYSVILSPDVGDFYFNWIGLVDADNTLISVSYSPLQFKYKTVGLAVGNTLTRNFLTQYANAAEITGINVAAEAWQIDFMGRLDSADENMRADMHDFFGNGYFIGDGFKIITEGATVKAKAGYGYVGGYRVVLGADQVINTGPLPKAIWLKAHLNKGPSSSNVVATFVAASTAEVLTNYTDAQNNKHFYVKLADVSAAYAVTEFRKFRNTADCLIKAIFDELDSKSNNGHVHTFDSIQGKPVSYPPSAHGHPWGEISGKPVVYPPSSHGHEWNEISGKPVVYPPSSHGHEWNEISGKPVVYPAAAHQHSANDITTGVFSDERIPNTMSGKNFTTTIAVGLGTGQIVVPIYGGNSGVNEGAAHYYFNGATTVAAFGNFSSIVGGNYDPSATVWSYSSIKFVVSSAANASAVLHQNGNLSIGSTTDNGQGKLQVAGNIVANNYLGNGSNLNGLNYSQLSFIPVQEGGGIGQLNNKVYVGWSNAGKLKATVDATDQGNIAMENWAINMFAGNSPRPSTAEINAGDSANIRQWSPDVVKQAIDYHAAGLFNFSRAQALTLLLDSTVWAGSFHFWKMGSLTFAIFEFAVNANNTNGEKSMGTLPAGNRPYTNYSTQLLSKTITSTSNSNLRLQLNSNGTLILHFENIAETLSGSTFFRSY